MRMSWTLFRVRRAAQLPVCTNAFRRLLVAAAALVLLPSFATAQSDFAARFEQAWRLVDERYWNIEGSGVDWRAVGERYRPRALAARNEGEFHEVLEQMYGELGDNHSVWVPPARAEEIRATYGNLPCLAVLGQNSFGEALDRTLQVFATKAAQDQDGQGRVGRVEYRSYGNVGYLRLPDLATPGIAGDTRAAVRSLTESGIDGLVLDLRGNPGGRLVEMMQIAGIFTRGFLWRVVTRWSLPLPYPALGTVETELPMAVLVDGEVNSAAEGLAGALQRSGRALVIGETTAGNVEAVLPFCLRDGSQAWIATGVLAPIGAATWEGTGVVPDVESDPDEALDVALQRLRQR